MHIALLAPMPPEQNGIADYAAHLRAALQAQGLRISTPLAGVGNDPQRAVERVTQYDWQGIDLVHAELGVDAWRSFTPSRPCASVSPGSP